MAACCLYDGNMDTTTGVLPDPETALHAALEDGICDDHAHNAFVRALL